MDTLALIIVLVAIVGSALQGISCLLSPRKPFSIGFLDLAVCALLIFLARFLRSGELVIAPEFGMFMVQGSAAVWFLRLALVAAGALPVLCWRRLQQFTHSPTHLWLNLFLGIAVGAWASTRIGPVNPFDLESLRVHAYDVWWPPFVAWLTYCLARIVIELVRARIAVGASSAPLEDVPPPSPAASAENPGQEPLSPPPADLALNHREGHSALKALALCAAMAAPMSRHALLHQELFDFQSRFGWQIVESAALFLAIFAVVLHYYRFRSSRFRTWTAILAGTIALALAAAEFFWSNPLAHLVIDLLLPFVVLGTLFVPVLGTHGPRDEAESPAEEAGQHRRPLREVLAKEALGFRQYAAFSTRGILRFLRSAGLSGLLFLAAVFVIPLCFIDLFSIGYLNRDLELALACFFWLAFSARLAESIFKTLPTLIRTQYWPFLTRLWGSVATRFHHGAKFVQAGITKFTSGSPWLVGARTVLLTTVALLGLIALGEMLNYGKLVVEPFEWKGDDADKTKVADRFTAGVINALGDMRRELVPVLLVGSPTDKRESNERIQTAILDDGALQNAIAKGSDLKISNVDIPLPIISVPIQKLVQWTLRIRVVRGTLHKTANGKYYLALMESGSGDSWKIYAEVPSTADASGPPATPPAQPGAPPAAPQASRAAAPDPPPPATGQHAPADTEDEFGGDSALEQEQPACDPSNDAQKKDPLDAFVNEAAFRIASSDPFFIQMGLTKNWKAYRHFRSGLQSWNCYQAYSHWSDLENAISEFRQAVLEDGTFAPAEYRLGVAFQSAGQYDGAIQAFKASLDSNPDLIQARIAEAQILSSYHLPYFEPPSIDSSPQRNQRGDEAREIFASVMNQNQGPVSQSNLLSALYGLCSDRFEQDSYSDVLAYPNKYYLTYYFCSRAQAVYHTIPHAGKNDPQRKIEAAILLYLADSLNYHDLQRVPVPVNQPSPLAGQFWSCTESSLDDEDLYKNGGVTRYLLVGSRFTSHALRYIRKSLELVPDDDYALCDRASGEAFLAPKREEKMLAMDRLQSSAGAHLYLARAIADHARKLALRRLYYPSYLDPWKNMDAYSRLAFIYYNLSMVEFYAGIRLSPTDPDALNDFAGTVWKWELDAKAGLTAPPSSDSYSREMREYYARAAIGLYRQRHDYSGQLIARDTLGEILLTLGRNEEAYDILKKAIEEPFDFYGYDEMHWDYAQSAVCSSATLGGPGGQKRLEDAESIFKQIKVRESQNENQPFSRTAGALDIAQASHRCFPPPDSVSVAANNVSFAGVTYQSLPGCSNTVFVRANVLPALPEGDVSQLRIDGAGTDEFKIAPEIQIMPPYHGHRLYFAQLFTNFGVSSPVVSFDIPDDSGNPACPHGRVILNFKVAAQASKLPSPATVAQKR